MEMTAEQLRFLRDQRGMTRDELATYLGDCTASTVNKWERGINPVPAWVADKMFSKLPVTFTVEQLAEMYELCREEGFTLGELIQESVAAMIKARRAAKTPTATNFSQPGNITSINKVAEEPPPYGKRKSGPEG